MDRKLLTAEKIIGNAWSLIKHIEKRKTLEIVTFPDLRQESKPININVLKKKYYL